MVVADRNTRRRFLRALSGCLLAVGAAAGALGWHAFVNAPFRPVVTRRKVALAGLPAAFHGLKVVQLSDFHHSSLVPLDYLERCVDEVNGLEPDIVCLTGDFVTFDENVEPGRNHARFAAPLGDTLARLKTRYGVFAVLGNHDIASGGDGVASALQDRGVPVLRDERVTLVLKGDRLPIVGVRDIGTEHMQVSRVMKGLDPAAPFLVLSHNPDLFAEWHWQPRMFMMSGHTHGGQVRFPFYGPWYVPSRYGTYYSQGLFREGERTMYVNRGLGVIRLPVRFNCPPEISVYELTAR